MTDKWNQDRIGKLILRSLGWCLCLTVWTTALLTTYPVEIESALVPSELRLLASKCLHVSAYAFLTAYIFWLPLRRWRWLLLAILCLHAAGTEFFQQFVPDRHGMISDVLIDHLGIAAGLALTWKLWLPRWSSRDRELPDALEPSAQPTRLADADTFTSFSISDARADRVCR